MYVCLCSDFRRCKAPWNRLKRGVAYLKIAYDQIRLRVYVINFPTHCAGVTFVISTVFLLYMLNSVSLCPVAFPGIKARGRIGNIGRIIIK